MTVPCLAIAWLSGIYAASIVRVRGWMLWLTMPLPPSVSFLRWGHRGIENQVWEHSARPNTVCQRVDGVEVQG